MGKPSARPPLQRPGCVALTTSRGGPYRRALRARRRRAAMASDAEYEAAAVKEIVDNMPLLQQPLEERRVMYTPGTPLDFYGARDGKLHANGAEFHIKGINWCVQPPR